MKRGRQRQTRYGRGFGLLAASLLLAGCEDDPADAFRTIPLVEPLQMTWPGRTGNSPYPGGPAVFQARAALRVDWKFRIEGHPSGAVFKREVAGQDLVNFSWDGHNNFGLADFARGDSCVARVDYARLDPADAEHARVVFRIGD